MIQLKCQAGAGSRKVTGRIWPKPKLWGYQKAKSWRKGFKWKVRLG